MIKRLLCLAAVSLVACAQNVDDPAVAPASSPTQLIKIEDNLIQEICYRGIVYIAPVTGGITAKINVNSTGLSHGVIPSPYIRCD